MNPEDISPDRMPGLWIAVLAAGLLAGAFWLFWPYLLLLRQHAPWWQFLVACAPGAAILLLTLLARRDPLPFGSALLILGCLSLGLGRPFGGWTLRLGLGIPMAAVGLGFIAYSLNQKMKTEN